jgi:hypothetical protein
MVAGYTRHVVVAGLLIVAATVSVGVVSVWWSRGHTPPARPRPVPDGDQEIAWLHTPTAYEAWDHFVRALKRIERRGTIPHFFADDAHAYPHRTTAVPEMIIGRADRVGRLHVRWYKVTEAVPQSRWVELLLQRSPAPLAIIAGWSSDRAAELAEALRDAPHPDKPVLLLTAATAEQVATDAAMTGPAGPLLLSLYDRTFRFCFSNRQMAEALSDFLLSEPSLRPHAGADPWLLATGTAWCNPWAAAASLLASEIPAFAIDWQDDPYSLDLSLHLRRELTRRCSTLAGGPRLVLIRSQIPFSTGPVHQPNTAEADAIRHLLQHLPPPPQRTLLLVPTVTVPARRVLQALVQEESEVGQRLVAVTGDGISVNTLFRDREVAWPIRTLPIPIVLFTHADPFAWDEPVDGERLADGYALPAPPPGRACSTTEDVEHFRRLIEVLISAAYQSDPPALLSSPEQLSHALRRLEPPFFDAGGNRRGGSGEHIVILRPFPPRVEDPLAEAVLEVYTRRPLPGGWFCLHRRLLYRFYHDRTP